MDLKKLSKTLLSSDSISGLSNLTGASGGDVTNVLAKALPALLSGANDQAKGNDTAESFVSALSQHAKSDTTDLSKFMNNVDLKDGSKIISHLLGSNKEDVIGDISRSTGVSAKDTSNIISAIAPLLMSLLGQQTDEDEDKDSGVAGLLGSLLDNVDVGDLLTGLLTDNASDDDDDDKDKDKKKKKAGSSIDAGKLIGSLLSSLKK